MFLTHGLEECSLGRSRQTTYFDCKYLMRQALHIDAFSYIFRYCSLSQIQIKLKILLKFHICK